MSPPVFVFQMSRWLCVARKRGRNGKAAHALLLAKMSPFASEIATAGIAARRGREKAGKMRE